MRNLISLFYLFFQIKFGLAILYKNFWEILDNGFLMEFNI